MDLFKQYNEFAKKFSEINDGGEKSNNDNRKTFYSHIGFLKPGMKLLDLGCGDGLDLVYYKKLGAEIYGIDGSEELLKIAKERLPDEDIRLGFFDQLPFQDNYFDAVLSKYAIMTPVNMDLVFKEIYRVLKPGGIMMYLVTHPFRQYFEKRDNQADYFTQKIVDSNILNNSITIKEPTHTMNEYLSKQLFENFDIQFYQEYWDVAAEQIDGKKYPGYFILIAKKRI